MRHAIVKSLRVQDKIFILQKIEWHLDIWIVYFRPIADGYRSILLSILIYLCTKIPMKAGNCWTLNNTVTPMRFKGSINPKFMDKTTTKKQYWLIFFRFQHLQRTLKNSRGIAATLALRVQGPLLLCVCCEAFRGFAITFNNRSVWKFSKMSKISIWQCAMSKVTESEGMVAGTQNRRGETHFRGGQARIEQRIERRESKQHKNWNSNCISWILYLESPESSVKYVFTLIWCFSPRLPGTWGLLFYTLGRILGCRDQMRTKFYRSTRLTPA